MKKHLKLLPLLAVLVSITFFVQCAKDDAGLYDDARQFGPQMNRESEYLEGPKKQQAIQALKAQFTKAGRPVPTLPQRSATGRSGENWTIDFDEVLLVTDSLGRQNYTYRVTHPAMSPTIFYNLVHTEYTDNKYRVTTVKLVKYQMSPEFEVQYGRGEKGIADFAGIITFTPLTGSRELLPDVPDDPVPPEEVGEPEPPGEPCEEETIIVVPPRNGGGGGGGGGTGGNGGGFSGLYEAINELPPGGSWGDSCWQWEVTYCNGGDDHVGNDASCTGSFKRGR